MSVDPLESLLSAALGETREFSATQPSFEDALNGVESTSENAPTASRPSKAKIGTIHSGDTDSSDDDDNRDFENRKYNECGRDVKHLLDAFKPTPATERPKLGMFGATWKTKPLLDLKGQPSSEPFFGIRVVNPLVSSQLLEERMAGREVVPLSKLKMFVRNVSADKDWVVAGAVVNKSSVKVSQNGKNYFMWTLSDLKIDLKTITVFLFGNACKELWKTNVGTVLGILNASVMEQREGTKDEAALSINNYQRVMILGQSKDFGTCKSIKKNGERCTAFVNTSICEFCIYHVRQEYQKSSSRRADLQSSFAGRGLTALRNKVLGKDQVFYAGKLYTSIPAAKSRKQTARDESRMQVLAGFGPKTRAPVKKTKKQKQAQQLELSARQRQRDLERLRQLGINSELNIDPRVVKFNAGLSRDVSVDDSRSLALDVISKLKRSDGGASRNESAVEGLGVNGTLWDGKAKGLSRDVSVDDAKSLTLDVISKLKKSKGDASRNESAMEGLEVNGTPWEEKGNSELKENEQSKTKVDSFDCKQSLDSNKTKPKQNNGALQPSKSDNLEELVDDSRKLWGDIKEKSNQTLLNIDLSQFLGDPFPITHKATSELTINPPMDKNKNESGNDTTLGKHDKSDDVINDRKLNSKDTPVKETKEASKQKNLTLKSDKVDIDLNTTSKNNNRAETANTKKTNSLSCTQGQPETSTTTQNKPTLSAQIGSLTNIPFLSGIGKSQIDLDAPIRNKQASRAKQNALSWIKSNGPIEKQDPNNTRGTARGKKRAVETLIQPSTDPKRAKIQENEFFSERFKKMMAAASNHMDLLEQHDNDEQEKYFQKLEMKERMEEKMLSTYKVPCKAVKCLTCKYTNFSAADHCKAERHPLKVFDAVKRFFKCGKCGNRTACLSVVPTLNCKNCGSGKWERTSMMKERRVEVAGPKLSIRGGEQKFVNSVVADANLDLMVPDI